MKSDLFFIPGNVPSLKNSKVMTKRGVFHSASVRKYLQKMGVAKYNPSKRTYENYKTVGRENLFLKYSLPIKAYVEKHEYPFVFGLHFVRRDNRKFDFGNAMEVLFDLWQAHGIIDEDNMDHILPIPMSFNDKFYIVEKEMAGVYIRVAPASVLNGVFDK